MCSILGVFDFRAGADIAPLRPLALSLSALQRHRGPDWSGVHQDEGAILVHERLAIVDPAGGSQPLRSEDGLLVLAVSPPPVIHRIAVKMPRCRVELMMKANPTSRPG